MADAAVKEKHEPANAVEADQELTDGFHLVIDALKLNGVNDDLRRARHPDHGLGT